MRARPGAPAVRLRAAPASTTTLSMLPKLYTELASWWQLLSAPADYAEEAAFYARNLLDAGDSSIARRSA